MAAQQRRSGKAVVSSSISRPSATTSPSTGSSNKFEKSGDKGKKKTRCNYCKASDHVIKSFPKIKAKEAKKKESNAATIADASTVVDSANVVQHAEWAFSVSCHYDPSLHDACMAVSVDSDVWYLTVVLQSTLPHIVICSLVLRLSLTRILSHVPTMLLI